MINPTLRWYTLTLRHHGWDPYLRASSTVINSSSLLTSWNFQRRELDFAGDRRICGNQTRNLPPQLDTGVPFLFTRPVRGRTKNDVM